MDWISVTAQKICSISKPNFPKIQERSQTGVSDIHANTNTCYTYYESTT